jgi:hypothetical protein
LSLWCARVQIFSPANLTDDDKEGTTYFQNLEKSLICESSTTF